VNVNDNFTINQLDDAVFIRNNDISNLTLKTLFIALSEQHIFNIDGTGLVYCFDYSRTRTQSFMCQVDAQGVLKRPLALPEEAFPNNSICLLNKQMLRAICLPKPCLPD
jgi:hypothetical protein